MTVSNETASITYAGNGATTVFAVPYSFLENSHLKVTLRASGGSESVKVLTTDYTVTGAATEPPTGQVTCVSFTPATGESLQIDLDVPVTQETDYVENDPFPAETHEKALDKLTMIAKQIAALQQKALHVAATDTTAYSALQVPSATARASRFLAFDISGNLTTSSGTGADSGLREDIDTGYTAAVIRVSTVAAMKALTGLADGALIVTAGFSVRGKGSGVYIYYQTPPGTQDNVFYHNQTTGGGQFYLLTDGSVSVMQAGAIGDGAANDRDAIAACLLAAKNIGCMRVFFPFGTYNVATPIVLDGYRNLTIYGEGYPVGATVGKISYLRYTGTSGNLITMNSCAGIEWSNIWFGYNSSSYTGDLVATNNPSGLDTTNMNFNRCLFSGETLSQVNATSLLRLEKTLNTQIEKCQFQYAQRGTVFYGYCNIITFRSNMFLHMGLYATYAYSGANQTIAFYDNTFEQRLSNAVQAAFNTAPGVAMQGFIFKGNWCGDVGAIDGLYWLNLDSAQAVEISNNIFGTAGAGANDYAIYLTNCFGVHIHANIFYDKAISFTNASYGLVVEGNSFGAATPQIAGRGFVSATSTWISNYNLTGGGLPRAKAYLTANQSVANTTHTAINFAGEIYDQGDVHSTSVNTSRFTVPVGHAGLWQFHAILLVSSVACTYIIRIVKNGGTIVSAISGLQSATAQMEVPIVATDIAADGDYYEVTYWQNSGVNQNVFGNAVSQVDTHMVAHKLMTCD